MSVISIVFGASSRSDLQLSIDSVTRGPSHGASLAGGEQGPCVTADRADPEQGSGFVGCGRLFGDGVTGRAGGLVDGLDQPQLVRMVVRAA